MDSGVTSHMSSDHGNLNVIVPSVSRSRVTIGDGSPSLVTHVSHALLTIPNLPLHLNNILVVPNLICNVVSIHQLVSDILCSIEFDMLGFFIKDLGTN